MLYTINKLKENAMKRTIIIIKGDIPQWDIVKEKKE